MLIFYEPALVIKSAGPRPTLKEYISFPHQAADFLVIHGNPSRVPAFLIGMNLSILCSSPVANVFYCNGSKDIHRGLFKLVPICLFI